MLSIQKKRVFRVESRIALTVYILTSTVSYFKQVNFPPLSLSQSYSGDVRVLSGHFALLLTEWTSPGSFFTSRSLGHSLSSEVLVVPSLLCGVNAVKREVELMTHESDLEGDVQSVFA